MLKRSMKIATLDEESLKKLRKMEEAMGTLLIALEPNYPLAELSEEQLARLQALEEELGIVLIALRP